MTKFSKTTMTDTLYTVRDCNDDAIRAHLNAEEAAIAILTYDGAHYAIERVGNEWHLFTRRANGKWDLRHPVEFSLETDEAAATREMFENVVKRADIGAGWKVEAITDEQYEAEILHLMDEVDEVDASFLEMLLTEWRAM